jgi:hypothetical protein
MIKKLLFALVICLGTTSLFSQNITYDLRCSTDNSTYELYVSRDASAAAPVTTAASSRITLVFPTDGGTRTINFTNESVSTYSELPKIINPNATNLDFFGFSASGGASLIGVLNADTPTLWMTFTPSDGTSQNARLFVNGSDPAPADPGMSGVDLSNVFTTISIAGTIDEYDSNISNSVNCNGLSLDEFSLSALSIYPNPTKNIIYTKGDISNLRSIDIYSITGKHILNIKKGFREINISQLESSIYFIQLNSDKASKIIKIIKE